jgi:nitroimidazol reductase NimA-like FMN-containing flavoprotein (pyridoxamine 5'-phosphate oxidase superfamily)
MRAKDKEITDQRILDAIINKALYFHLSFCSDNQPYSVPLNFGYDGSSIYFHSAAKGQKTSILKENPRVCLVFVIGTEMIPDPDLACDWGIQFMSVIAEGKAENLTNRGEKQTGLNEIMKHYSGKSWTFPEKEIDRTDVWKIPLQSISGKKSSKDLKLSDLD